MKKKKLIFVASCMILVSAITVSTSGSKNKSMVDLIVLSQIEALANNEGGTDVETCYTESTASLREYVIPCNSSTTSSKIYPCEQKTLTTKGPTTLCTK